MYFTKVQPLEFCLLPEFKAGGRLDDLIFLTAKVQCLYGT